MTTLLRASIFHTPKNPFEEAGALECLTDSALAFENETILAVGDYALLHKEYPEAEVLDHRDAFLFPGFVDTHVHLPQLPVIGAMGLRLLEWLEERTLPVEERFADEAYARAASKTFLAHLLKNGTTTALVFGSHFAGAMDLFFEEAEASGLRVTAGLVVSDRNLTEKLHRTPEEAFERSRALIKRWHNLGRLRYAVTPRFSLSCTDAMLEICGDLLQESPDLLFTSHLNEQTEEISAVLRLFDDARDYLATYDAHGLVTPRSVFAHNVHVYDRELERLGGAGSSVAHCPSSNMFIGSGLFPMRAHLRYGVPFALGSDVGGGTGFSLFKEGLMAYQTQMLREDGYALKPAHLLYLATLAGAEALGLGDKVGSFAPGKEADAVLVRPLEGSTLKAVLSESPSLEASLAAIFTLAREHSVAQVYVGGKAMLESSLERAC